MSAPEYTARELEVRAALFDVLEDLGPIDVLDLAMHFSGTELEDVIARLVAEGFVCVDEVDGDRIVRLTIPSLDIPLVFS